MLVGSSGFVLLCLVVDRRHIIRGYYLINNGQQGCGFFEASTRRRKRQSIYSTNTAAAFVCDAMFKAIEFRRSIFLRKSRRFQRELENEIAPI